MKRTAVDPVKGLFLIAVLLAGMGVATLWRHGDRSSLAESSGAIVQIAIAVTLLVGLAVAFLAPALSRRRLEHATDWPDWRPLEDASRAVPPGKGPIIEGEVLEPRAGPRRAPPD
jgi:hypothetical protein